MTYTEAEALTFSELGAAYGRAVRWRELVEGRRR